jgi:ADP-ribose pyrophosphatase YjhB (NUDIX family)
VPQAKIKEAPTFDNIYKMNRYTNKTRVLVAVDCIIFGFRWQRAKIIACKKEYRPEKGKWSLIGGFVLPHEDCEHAAIRTLKDYTGS